MNHGRLVILGSIKILITIFVIEQNFGAIAFKLNQKPFYLKKITCMVLLARMPPISVDPNLLHLFLSSKWFKIHHTASIISEKFRCN